MVLRADNFLLIEPTAQRWVPVRIQLRILVSSLAYYQKLHSHVGRVLEASYTPKLETH